MVDASLVVVVTAMLLLPIMVVRQSYILQSKGSSNLSSVALRSLPLILFFGAARKSLRIKCVVLLILLELRSLMLMMVMLVDDHLYDHHVTTWILGTPQENSQRNEESKRRRMTKRQEGQQALETFCWLLLLDKLYFFFDVSHAEETMDGWYV